LGARDALCNAASRLVARLAVEAHNRPVMSVSKDQPRDQPPDKPAEAPDNKRSGRAAVDDRGNTVWEWQLETGVYSRDITTQRLKKLDLGDLSIAETAQHQRPSGLSEKDVEPKKPVGGFNPYDSAGASTGGNPYDNARNTQRRTQQSSSPGAPPARKPMDLKRLEEWMEIRKRLEQQKKDDDED
jgi:hypothetical protein